MCLEEELEGLLKNYWNLEFTVWFDINDKSIFKPKVVHLIVNYFDKLDWSVVL